ncbi:MAG: MobC family plasmid mobilization relaxosome protein [Ancrocorticia sp.]
MEQRPVPNRRRKIRREINFSEEEMVLIARRMRATGQTNFSTFARELLTQAPLTISYRPAIADEINRQLGPIGNNINQLAKKANTDNVATFEQIMAVQRMLSEVRAIVARELGSDHGSSEDRTDPDQP